MNEIYFTDTYRDEPEKLKQSLSETQMICYRNAFLFLFVTYPSTTAKIFQLLPGGCKTLCLDKERKYCYSFLRADYSLQCNEGDYSTFVILAQIMAIYPIAFPLVLTYMLWKIRSNEPFLHALWRFSKRKAREVCHTAKMDRLHYIVPHLAYFFDNCEKSFIEGV